MPLQNADVFLDVFEIALYHLGQRIDRSRMSSLDGPKQCQALPGQKVAGGIKAGRPNRLTWLDVAASLDRFKSFLETPQTVPEGFNCKCCGLHLALDAFPTRR